MAKIAFIGLGTMGYPMAGHISQRGKHEVIVYNRTQSKAEKWVREFGGNCALTPAEASRNCDFIFSCVGDDNDLHAITVGENGAFETIQENAIFVDNTTTSRTIACNLAKIAHKKGFYFLDAPVSGGEAGAKNGTLTVMIGGEKKAFDAAKSVIGCYSKAISLMGPSGNGQLTKMVNQICIAGLIQSLAEAMAFAHNANLDMEKVISVISKGAAQSWQMENRWKSMNDGKYDHGFAVDWMRKDLDICLKQAKLNQSLLPITSLVDQFYSEVQKMGGGRWDTSSLLARLEKK